MINQRSRCCLAITARDTYHFRLCIASRELDFTNDMCALGHEFLNHRRLFWNARAFDYFIGIKDFIGRVMSFFPLNAMLIKQVFILILD